MFVTPVHGGQYWLVNRGLLYIIHYDNNIFIIIANFLFLNCPYSFTVSISLFSFNVISLQKFGYKVLTNYLDGRFSTIMISEHGVYTCLHYASKLKSVSCFRSTVVSCLSQFGPGGFMCVVWYIISTLTFVKKNGFVGFSLMFNIII